VDGYEAATADISAAGIRRRLRITDRHCGIDRVTVYLQDIDTAICEARCYEVTTMPFFASAAGAEIPNALPSKPSTGANAANKSQ